MDRFFTVARGIGIVLGIVTLIIIKYLALMIEYIARKAGALSVQGLEMLQKEKEKLCNN